MNKFKLEKIKAEWEKSLLIALSCILFLLLIIWLWPNNQEGSVNQPGTLPAKPNYVDVDSDYWLKPTFLKGDVSIMTFVRALPPVPEADKTPTPSRPNAGQKTPTPGKTPTPTPGKTPAADNVTSGKTDPPKVAPVKPEPPQVITLLYRGLYKGLSDKKLAFIKGSDSRSKKSINAPLSEGAKIFTVLTIVSFDENSITLAYGEGRGVTLIRGEEKKLNYNE